MRYRTIFAVAACIASFGGGAAVGQPLEQGVRGEPIGDRQQLVHIVVQNQTQLDKVMQIGEVWNCRIGVGPLDVQVDDAGLAVLRGLGLRPEVLIDDVQAFTEAQLAEIEARRHLRDITWFQNYHTLSEIEAYVDGLVAAFPNLVTKITIGNSLEGRAIFGMRITGPGAPPDRPEILYNGCQHAREWISPATMMYVADQLANGYGSDTRITTLLDSVEFVIIPVTNPDGYEYTWVNSSTRLWRKNRRNNGDGTYGVDLNRNWSVYWGGTGSSGITSDETYHGTSAFSEPESTALRDFALAEPNLIAHIDWHSYSQLILYPYGGDYVLPPEPDLSLFVDLSAGMRDEIYAVHGTSYQDIPSHELYLAAGDSSDWFYDVRGVYSWGIELRPTTSVPGFELPPDEIIPTGEEVMPAVLLMGETLILPLRMDWQSGPPSLVEAGMTTSVFVTIDPGTSTLVPGGARLYTRIGSSGAFTSQVLSNQSGNEYSGVLPATPCGETVEFYAEADAVGGGLAMLGSAASSYSALAQDITVIVSDNAETDIGWGVSGDAVDGQWDRGVPVNAGRGDPPTDGDGSGQAWLTDNDASNGGNSDVDNGTTYLTSPSFDLTDGAMLSYLYWFNDVPNGTIDGDAYRVDISTDDGANWTNVRTYTTTTGSWRSDSIDVGAETATSSTVRFRFSADDLGNQNVIEGGLDAFLIQQTGCSGPVACSPGDLTTQGAGSGDPGYGVPDGQVSAADLNYYVNAYVAADLAIADVTTQGAGSGDPGYGVPDGQVTAADINYFVNLWIAGCP